MLLAWILPKAAGRPCIGVVVREVSTRIGNLRLETGDEADGIEGLDLLVVVAVPGQVRGGGRAQLEAQADEADGVAQALAGESRADAAVASGSGQAVVVREAGVAMLAAPWFGVSACRTPAFSTPARRRREGRY